MSNSRNVGVATNKREKNAPSYAAIIDHSSSSVGRATIETIQRELLAWYDQHHRDLPWRRTRDPWRILVSEVMLQQIQVVRAIPFYHRFLDRFPSVHHLAEAPLGDAIRTWGDLGRYKRVVNLHRTARLVVNDHGGAIPSDPDILRSLPGIGPYTAGAVACFAFERDVPFLDTNIRRVLHRLFVGPDLPAPTAPDRALLPLARLALPPGQGWAWNQALIEFGALHCTARRPACVVCPLQHDCAAFLALGEPIAAARETRTKAPAAPYERSNRYFRGRVLARLREQPVAPSLQEGVAVSDLRDGIVTTTTDDDTVVERVNYAIQSLKQDGLIISENRQRYRIDGDGSASEVEQHLRLP